MYVKFIYSEKANNFCEISTVDLTVTKYIGQIYDGDFVKFCGLLRMYELTYECNQGPIPHKPNLQLLHCK